MNSGLDEAVPSFVSTPTGVVHALLDQVHAPYGSAAVCVAAGSVALLRAFGKGPAAGHGAALRLGAAREAEVGVVSSLVRRYFGQAALGRRYGLAFGPYTLGTAIGPVSVGASFDPLGGVERCRHRSAKRSLPTHMGTDDV